MANVMNNRIVVENCNDDVIKFMDDLRELKDNEDTEEIARKVFGDEIPEEFDGAWYIENCGAKWMTFEGSMLYDNNNFEIIIHSAWSPIINWVNKLHDVLQELQPDVVVYDVYIDEAYNSAGIFYVCYNYDNHHEEDMDDWDLDLLNNDESGEYMEEFDASIFTTLNHIKEEHKNENK
jgi:hypothetical protein